MCCVCCYFVTLDVSLGFHVLLCVCYVNPAYGCQIEINCMYKSYVEIQDYEEATKLTKRRKRFFDESSTPDTELTARDQFLVDVFYALWIVSLQNFASEWCIFCGAQTVWFSNGVRIPDSRRFSKTCCLSC